MISSLSQTTRQTISHYPQHHCPTHRMSLAFNVREEHHLSSFNPKPRESETITPPPLPRSKPTTGFSLMASNTISFLQIPISTSQFCNEKPHNSSLLPLPLSSFYGNKLLISHSKLRNLSLKGNKPSTNVTVLSTLPTK